MHSSRRALYSIHSCLGCIKYNIKNLDVLLYIFTPSRDVLIMHSSRRALYSIHSCLGCINYSVKNVDVLYKDRFPEEIMKMITVTSIAILLAVAALPQWTSATRSTNILRKSTCFMSPLF